MRRTRARTRRSPGCRRRAARPGDDTRGSSAALGGPLALQRPEPLLVVLSRAAQAVPALGARHDLERRDAALEQRHGVVELPADVVELLGDGFGDRGAGVPMVAALAH